MAAGPERRRSFKLCADGSPSPGVEVGTSAFSSSGSSSSSPEHTKVLRTTSTSTVSGCHVDLTGARKDVHLELRVDVNLPIVTELTTDAKHKEDDAHAHAALHHTACTVHWLKAGAKGVSQGPLKLPTRHLSYPPGTHAAMWHTASLSPTFRRLLAAEIGNVQRASAQKYFLISMINRYPRSCLAVCSSASTDEGPWHARRFIFRCLIRAAVLEQTDFSPDLRKIHGKLTAATRHSVSTTESSATTRTNEMAEVAALAHLTAVICCGLKLSISLYDFATSLGTAGREVKSLGTDITLFCSVLKQVQSKLSQVSSFRISENDIETTQDILDQSSSIFDELFSIFAKLQKDEGLPVDFLTRVTWTFNRAKVLLLRESLQSCTAMLHLMLATMSFAQRIATKGTAFDDTAEAEEERALTRSLCLAQQSVNERLEELEKQCLVEESQRSDSALTMLATDHENYKSYSPEEDVDDSDSDLVAPDTILGIATIESRVGTPKITSLLPGTIVQQRENSRKNKCLTWASISSEQQSVLESDRLLRNWTNHCDPLTWNEGGSDDESLLPSDSVSRCYGYRRSHGESRVHSFTTIFDSITSTSDLGVALPLSGSTPSIEEWHTPTTIRSLEAADRSRQKVAKLTGEDYTAITADWMWRVNEQTASTALLPLPLLEPLECKEPFKPRKKSRPLRWGNNRALATDKNNGCREIEARLRSQGLI